MLSTTYTLSIPPDEYQQPIPSQTPPRKYKKAIPSQTPPHEYQKAIPSQTPPHEYQKIPDTIYSNTYDRGKEHGKIIRKKIDEIFGK